MKVAILMCVALMIPGNEVLSLMGILMVTIAAVCKLFGAMERNGNI